MPGAKLAQVQKCIARESCGRILRMYNFGRNWLAQTVNEQLI